MAWRRAESPEARRRRQDVLYRETGPPRYEVVIDELAIRRYAAQAEVVGKQIDHLLLLGHERTNIIIRALPFTARIDAQMVPRSAFSIYSYRDPDDPVVFAVDIITSDLGHHAERPGELLPPTASRPR
ncbi:Scr1 family TA system antitoxin-like transcriptional regulator [Kineosporia babensis]|uniref:Scr1 family TA system antitoxin-like transcriptional regulator n=1 Tax=Kineosporia babensis TaxID=499548 RepID=UPI002F3521C3